MIPTKIFLDLDDVCNQFTMYALESIGCSVKAHEDWRFNPKWGFDIIKASNFLHPSRSFTLKSFWDAVNRRVWATTPESEEFRWLFLRCVDLVGCKNVCILTTPTIDPECLAGKLEWIHEHFPEWMWRQYCMTPQKHLLAGSDALLIDDSDRNVEAFRANGGQAILMPRPWNIRHGSNAKKHIDGTLDVIFRRSTNVR